MNEILIVEDDIYNIITLEAMLEFLCNKKCDKAMNGQEAVDKVKEMLKRRKNYKLIFMDCNMPIMDGISATIQIRELENQFQS